jgi:hypothetical protein
MQFWCDSNEVKITTDIQENKAGPPISGRTF